MEALNTGLIILILLLSVFLIRSIITIIFQKSTYHAYRESLTKGDTDKAILKGRNYYLSLSKKNRKRNGITDIAQIDTRVKEDVAERIIKLKT